VTGIPLSRLLMSVIDQRVSRLKKNEKSPRRLSIGASGQ
jgi:hypothetical protein